MPTTDLNTDPHSVAAWIARFLKARGVDRIFGLQGGHIQPIWDWLFRTGIRIVDVRHEGAAVLMAQAHAELTGTVGVALVTAGPGVTNTVTAVANAALARTPLLLLGGCAPRPQANMGALQDVPHVDILRPIARFARTLRIPEQVIRELDEAWSRALGDAGEPGPVFVEIPTDVLRAQLAQNLVLPEWLRAKPRRRLPPDPSDVDRAVDLLWSARRPLVISGKGARGATAELLRLLDATGAVYLDTQESRGLVPKEHPAFVGAVRARAMAEADLVFVIGRKLDYQLGYGSPAVFPNARFIRLSDNAGELFDNRRGELDMLATPALALTAMLDAAGNREPATDRNWTSDLRKRHSERVKASATRAAPALGADGKIHPAFLLAQLRGQLAPEHIAIADGGDLLSFARIGLDSSCYLDSGAFGCLGVGVPFTVAAALAFPDRQVVCVTGDGAFGLHAMELDTAVRHNAKITVVVSNNAAWNIERFDQETNYGGRVVGTLLRHCDYAGLARALGLYAERIERAEELASAISRALANPPSLLDVVTSQRAVSSDAEKGLGFVPDFQPLLAWDEAERRRRGA